MVHGKSLSSDAFSSIFYLPYILPLIEGETFILKASEPVFPMQVVLFLPGSDERQNKHLQHPHQQLSREREVDLGLGEKQKRISI